MLKLMAKLLDKARAIWNSCCHKEIGEVWMLHHVSYGSGPDEQMRLYNINPDRLERLIGQYRDNGYDFISLDELNPRRRKFVAITLDDGNEDNYSVAYPLFKRLGCPFCVFVCSDYVFKPEKRAEIHGMTPSQLKELSEDPLCTIGAHTISHRHLDKMGKHEQEYEICGNISALEYLTGHSVEYFAYPYGDCNEDTINVLKRSKIKKAFLAWGGAVKKGLFKAYRIPRVYVK